MPRKPKVKSWAQQMIERYSQYDPKTTIVLAVGNLVELARIIDDLQTRVAKLEKPRKAPIPALRQAKDTHETP
jgi:hypothetical protein